MRTHNKTTVRSKCVILALSLIQGTAVQALPTIDEVMLRPVHASLTEVTAEAGLTKLADAGDVDFLFDTTDFKAQNRTTRELDGKFGDVLTNFAQEYRLSQLRIEGNTFLFWPEPDLVALGQRLSTEPVLRTEGDLPDAQALRVAVVRYLTEDPQRYPQWQKPFSLTDKSVPVELQHLLAAQILELSLRNTPLEREARWFQDTTWDKAQFFFTPSRDGSTIQDVPMPFLLRVVDDSIRPRQAITLPVRGGIATSSPLERRGSSQSTEDRQVDGKAGKLNIRVLLSQSLAAPWRSIRVTRLEDPITGEVQSRRVEVRPFVADVPIEQDTIDLQEPLGNKVEVPQLKSLPPWQVLEGEEAQQAWKELGAEVPPVTGDALKQIQDAQIVNAQQQWRADPKLAVEVTLQTQRTSLTEVLADLSRQGRQILHIDGNPDAALTLSGRIRRAPLHHVMAALARLYGGDWHSADGERWLLKLPPRGDAQLQLQQIGEPWFYQIREKLPAGRKAKSEALRDWTNRILEAVPETTLREPGMPFRQLSSSIQTEVRRYVEATRAKTLAFNQRNTLDFIRQDIQLQLAPSLSGFNVQAGQSSKLFLPFDAPLLSRREPRQQPATRPDTQ